MPKFPVYSSSLYENIIRVLKPHVSMRRYEKITQLFNYRLKDTVLIFENIRDPLNLAACFRTADAYGIQHIYILNNWGEVPFFTSFNNTIFQSTSNKKSTIGMNNQLNTSYSTVDAGSIRWLTIHQYRNTQELLQHLRDNNYKIFSSDLADGAEDIYQATHTALLSSSSSIPTISSPSSNSNPSPSSTSSTAQVPYRPRIALVFGNEKRGVSRGMAMNSDYRFFIPQLGFVQSLNISVACALSTQLFLYRTNDYYTRSLQAHQFRSVMDNIPLPNHQKNQKTTKKNEHEEEEEIRDDISKKKAQIFKATVLSPPSIGTGNNQNTSLASTLQCEPLPPDEMNELLVRWLLGDLPMAAQILDRAGVRPDFY